jgi:hypothetical protein
VKKELSTPLVVCFALIAGTLACRADTTLRVRTVIHDSAARADVENPNVDSTIYYRRKEMRRKDTGEGSLSSIANCTTRTGVLIDSAAREYRTYKVMRFWNEQQLRDLQKSRSSVVQVESKTIDTGERKMFFGHPAKHFITTIRRAVQDKNGGEDILDGWYIDHEVADNNCAPDYAHHDPFYVLGTALVMYPEIAQFKHSGPMPEGLTVMLTRTVRYATGGTVTVQETVEELSDSPLPETLFKLPTGFRENHELWRSNSP